MNVKIEIYTKVYCVYCHRAKELLRIKGLDFVEYDITDDLSKAAEMRCRAQRETVPEIFINDALVGGCAELFEMDERGDLDSLLGFVIAPRESYQ